MHIGLAVVVCALGVARAVDSRLATQGIDLQSRIVGKAVVAIVVEDVLGFGETILLQRSPVFGNILVATDVGQG